MDSHGLERDGKPPEGDRDGEVDALIVSRVGIADGRYAIPDDFDAADAEIEQIFAGHEEEWLVMMMVN
ncbi:hypothetical protein [Acidithiobacillus sulfuriphilus]|uniref:hypothetical protein n=1 Tax=Acidithiobacillus sulfuriphilus TaxID=1867749 RepID=UPI003F619643